MRKKYFPNIGDVINSWEIIDILPGNKVLCKCLCGKERIKSADKIYSGKIKGCLLCTYASNIEYSFKIGDKYSNWTVIENSTNRYVNCECSCGAISKISRADLRLGLSTKCKNCSSKNLQKYTTQCVDLIPTLYYSMVMSRAIKKKLEFNLSYAYLNKLLETQNYKCALSNLPIVFSYEMREKLNKDGYIRKYFDYIGTTASLDRVDSSKGYTEDNVQWVHKDINIMKLDLDQNRFVTLCKLVANYEVNLHESLI